MFKTNYRKLWIVIFCIFMINNLFVLHSTLGTWTQDTVSSIDDIISETVRTAFDNTPDLYRLKIGIGEEVKCILNEDTWVDHDCLNGTTSVWDTIGDKHWACGDGGTVNPSGTTESNMTTFTADKSPNEVVSVTVKVYDSGTQYPDDYINKNINFEVVAPDSIVYYYLYDVDPPDIGVPNFDLAAWTSGTKMMAVETYYLCVLSPPDVNFHNINIQENFGSGTATDTWPNGDSWSSPTGIKGPITIQNHHFGDEQGTKIPYQYSKLYNPSTSQYEDFETSNPIPFEYQNEDDEWVPFTTSDAFRYYYGEDGSAEAAAVGEYQETLPWGDRMGPYEYVPEE